MQVRIEQDLDSAGEAFAAEILRALQFWHNELKIIIQLCTGESPFIGYRKMGGDKALREKGVKKYNKIGAILDTWDKPKTRLFLKNNGLNPKLKPDMKKVIAFAIDAIFPQKRNDYFAFANLLNNVCELWGIPKQNRNLFYGDIYVTKENDQWEINRIPEGEYKEIIESIDKEGLKILEYQARCLLNGNKIGFALNASLRIEGNKVIGQRLKRDDKGDFRVKEVEIEPLKSDHIQYKYLESMHNQALMMQEKLKGFGGAHITLLGVGPSYEGKGHIGFCEEGTLPEQTCFIAAINDYDATFHIAGAHAKEFYGFKNMFVTDGDVRMPKFGFITYGPADLMYRQSRNRPEQGKRDISKEVIVIVIATGNLKSNSVAKAIEGEYDCQYPLSLTQNSRGIYVLDKTSARDLRIKRYPWEFQAKGKEKQEKPDSEITASVIRPEQIIKELKLRNIAEGNNILLINPHMDDDFLAMMHLLKEMAPHYNIHACYTSLGYTAVYSDYVLGLLEVAGKLSQKEIENLNSQVKENLLKELIRESRNIKRIPRLDYEVLPYMNEKERTLRAKILLIDLNERYDLDILKLREFLAEVERRKPHNGGQDIDIMRFLKTSARFMEAVSGLMSLGVAYKNIYWPLDMSFYGAPGRPLAIKQEDINKIKGIIKAVKPKMVVFNGEGFPDFGSHSNTEIGTYIALFELLKERKVSPELLLFQWAGVWDRIRFKDSGISVVLTREELQDFYNAFNYFYPTQAPYAPVLNASSAEPQPFSRDIIVNARKSAQELLDLTNVPEDIKDILNQEGGVLNYKLARLRDAKTKCEFLSKQKELMRSRFSIDISSNAALIGPAPYPEKLNELPSPIIREMFRAGAISAREKRLFGWGETLQLSVDNMLELVDRFHKDMDAGLQGNTSSLAMLPTFADNPTGKEKGVFLAIDLGGSIFRLLLVRLLGSGRKPDVIIEKYSLKATCDYTQASANELFAAIARYIRMFLTKHKKRIERFGYKKPYPLGFTFSFSVSQTAIDKAFLKKCAKDFRMTGLLNQDVVQFLRKAISDEGLDDFIKVVSLNNDTVATLATRKYQDKNCDIGGIVGTGTNFCYVELLENIRTLTAEQKTGYGRETMIINIESGDFNKIPQNPYDKILDRDSTNIGEHITEKMVSGLYLGELSRLVLMDLISKGLLFKKEQLTKKEIAAISQKGSFTSPFMTEIAEDNSGTLKGVGTQLTQWGVKSQHISLEDKKMVKEVCSEVARRAARITAVVIFAIVTHIDEHIQRHHTVAMDGSLFEKHPNFKDDMRKAIKELSMEVFQADFSDKISLKLTTDGSGVGAAIIAAMNIC